MNLRIYTFLFGVVVLISPKLYAQSDTNCFLTDYEPRTAIIPESIDADVPTRITSLILALEDDTIGKISRYVFGNAIAAWAGAHSDPEFVEGVGLLAPTLIRFPGGSWSNGYFWNGVPFDVPDSIYDGTTYDDNTQTARKAKFWGQTGVGGWQTTPGQYYTLRTNSNVSEGLITVNYGYARYGTSADPVAKAAKLAADWVRDDAGRTKFWEIGNENGGPWEYGWMIDTALNQDGQPQIITGELYGQHFRVFADSMRKAAAEIGATIYIGGQIVIDGENSWNFVDRTWNEGFYREVGDAADFYIIHNYFDNTNISSILNRAESTLEQNMEFIQQDIIDKEASPRPIALTEYNMHWDAVNPNTSVSYIGGMQAVVLIGELIENNFGLGARWLLLSGDGTMFYGGSDANYLYHPHADFYYLAYMQKMIGDLAIGASSSSNDVVCYASTYSSGETALIVVNKSFDEQVISVGTGSVGVGEKYYIYSFTGGTDDEFSLDVFINGVGPDTYQWGPYNQLFDINADAYTIGDEIKFISPGLSVQMILIEAGTNHIEVDESILHMENREKSEAFYMDQIYPNPVNSTSVINYQLPENALVTLRIFDAQGRDNLILVNEYQNAGAHSVEFNASELQSGVYFCRIEAGHYHDVKKMIILN